MSRPVMISVSGIRGIVGDGLNPSLIADFAAAAGTFYGRGPVLVGRDSRPSGEMVRNAVFSGLAAVGCDPVDLGVCSTPTVEMAVQSSNAVGGIIITASHNPVEWNALKLLTSRGIFLDQDQGAEVKAVIDSGRFAWAPWDGVGRVSSREGASEAHLEQLLALPLIDVDKIRGRRFSVACDCVNGAGGTILPQLFDALNCTVLFLNLEPTGIFAHTPEPVPENLTELLSAVKEHGSDIGFAVDPDVDRCAVVDETGAPLGEEYSVTLAADYLLSRKKGPVVVNLSTTRAVEDVAERAGVPLYRTKVGEAHVVKKMIETGAVIGGEGNGGVILPELHPGRDAPLAIALTLQAMADTGKKISTIRRELPDYYMSKQKMHIGGADPDDILAGLTEKYRSGRISTLDGLKIDFSDHWVHIRKSNTEPIIRVMAEAGSREKAAAVCDRFLAEITAQE